jgi:hypothetical protein
MFPFIFHLKELLFLRSRTSCRRSCAASCHPTRQSTVSSGCSPTPAWTPYRAHSTTCPSPPHSMESQTSKPRRRRRRRDSNWTSSKVWVWLGDEYVIVNPLFFSQRLKPFFTNQPSTHSNFTFIVLKRQLLLILQFCL